MGWASLPATETTDWTDWDFRIQFANALIERGIACGYYSASKPSYSTFQEGKDAHKLTGSDWDIGFIQAEIELMRRDKGFVDPDALTGASEYVGYYPADTFWADVGVAAAARPSETMQASTSPYVGGMLIAVGYKFAVLKTAASDWAGHDGEVATCTGTSPYTWSFSTPADDYLIEQKTWSASSKRWKGVQYRRRDASATDWPVVTDVGWTRKHPREIEALDDAGSNGQRARLVGGSNSNTTMTRFMGVRAAPPSSPYTDGYYGVQKGATGAWATHDGQRAKWTGAAWSFTADASGTQFLFHSKRGLGDLIPLRNARAWITYGGEWHPVAALYEHDGAKWALDSDQTGEPDLVTEYGPAQAGDYVGPWIWNELRAALDELVIVGCTNTLGTWGGQRKVHTYTHGWDAAWADAKTAGEAAWAAAGTTTTAPGYDEIGPWVFTYGSHTSGSGYETAMTRRHEKQKGTFAEGDTSIKCDVHFYAIGQLYDADDDTVFGDHGDDVANGSATKWHSKIAQTNAAEFVSDIWEEGRDATQPGQWCDQPDDDDDSRKGYKISGYLDAYVVKDFAVVDGFEYQ